MSAAVQRLEGKLKAVGCERRPQMSRLRLLGLLAVIAACLAVPATAPAAVIEVTRGVDAFGTPDAADPTRCANPELGSNRCRLRDALALAQDGDTVRFGAIVVGTIVLNQPLEITKQVTVDLNGRQLLVRRGTPISAAGTVTLRNGRLVSDAAVPDAGFPASSAALLTAAAGGSLSLEDLTIVGDPTKPDVPVFDVAPGALSGWLVRVTFADI